MGQVSAGQVGEGSAEGEGEGEAEGEAEGEVLHLGLRRPLALNAQLGDVQRDDGARVGEALGEAAIDLLARHVRLVLSLHLAVGGSEEPVSWAAVAVQDGVRQVETLAALVCVVLAPQYAHQRADAPVIVHKVGRNRKVGVWHALWEVGDGGGVSPRLKHEAASTLGTRL